MTARERAHVSVLERTTQGLKKILGLSVLLLACGGTPSEAAKAPLPPTAPTAPPLPRIVLAHVTVVDAEHGTEAADRNVVIEGDHIVAVLGGAEPAPASPSTRVVDGRGKYVIPGLWDMHVHFNDRAAGRMFMANGVTGVRVMSGNPPTASGTKRLHSEMANDFDAESDIGPRMIIASRILDGPKPVWPFSVRISTAEEGRSAVDEAKANGVDFIKVYSLLPRAGFFAIAEESKKVGLPFAGHVPESVSVAEASDAGQKSIEHLTGMLVACSSREDELRTRRTEFAKTERTSAEWAKFRREQAADAMASYDAPHAAALFAKLVANGTWQCPTLTVHQAFASLDDPAHASDPRLVYVPSFLKRMWDPKVDFRTKNREPEDYASVRVQFEKNMALVRALDEAHVPLLAGTDEPNPYCFAGFSLHDELGLLVKAGLTPAAALRAATSAPARYLGFGDKLGAVGAGKLADLVVLDADPLADIGNTRRITAVVSRGTLYERPALDKMLSDVRGAVKRIDSARYPIPP
jgi:imidazolonepropionase-like amidohydrolase